MKISQSTIVALVTAALLLVSSRANAAEPPIRRVPAVERVLIISCDGMRPDVLLCAKAPNIRALMEQGCFTFWARTIPVAITLPSHTSMLTGVYPEKHGITWNDAQPDAGYPKVPTLFELAKKAGYTTSLVSGKAKFITLAKPGTVDWVSINQGVSADQIADEACKVIAENKPEVMFIHFPGADSAGHAIGWGTAAQIDAVDKIDDAIGRVVARLKSQELLKSTVIILSADHGGAGRTHGGLDPRSQHIPWIIAGPGIRTNVDLTEDPGLVVNTIDTFATACFFMGIAPGDVDGKPIKQVLTERGELLITTKPSDKK